MGKFIDLAGQKFGRLTVLERAENKGKSVVWLCRCDCGQETKVTPNHLKSGHTKSCGCLHIECAVNQGHKNATHGMKGTRLYKIWGGIKTRCLNCNDAHYKDYLGRGITICDEWKNSFENFRDWAMSNGYREDLTIDRIDVNGNYEPSNCRWATQEEQQNNKRTNHLITFDGKTQNIKKWSIETGIRSSTIGERLKRGWSIEKALTTPTKEG